MFKLRTIKLTVDQGEMSVTIANKIQKKNLLGCQQVQYYLMAMIEMIKLQL